MEIGKYLNFKIQNSELAKRDMSVCFHCGLQLFPLIRCGLKCLEHYLGSLLTSIYLNCLAKVVVCSKGIRYDRLMVEFMLPSS